MKKLIEIAQQNCKDLKRDLKHHKGIRVSIEIPQSKNI
jgi:hypothetical protein